MYKIIYIDEILEKWGYIAVSIYNSMAKIKNLKLTNDKYLKNLIEYYIKHISKNNFDGLNGVRLFLECLPSLKNLYKIIYFGWISKREYIIVKIILDIYEHYYKNYDFPIYTKLVSEYIPTAMLFYTNLNDNELKEINLTIDRKDLHDLCRMIIFKSNKKEDYIKMLNEMKKSYNRLSEGLKFSNFCN
jgi:hypothetical protein